MPGLDFNDFAKGMTDEEIREYVDSGARNRKAKELAGPAGNVKGRGEHAAAIAAGLWGPPSTRKTSTFCGETASFPVA